MEWIVKMIEPVIKDCKTPEEAEEAVIKWGKSQEPRDAALALIAIKFINEQYARAIE
jgi:hypothetical protein